MWLVLGLLIVEMLEPAIPIMKKLLFPFLFAHTCITAFVVKLKKLNQRTHVTKRTKKQENHVVPAKPRPVSEMYSFVVH